VDDDLSAFDIVTTAISFIPSDLLKKIWGKLRYRIVIEYPHNIPHCVLNLGDVANLPLRIKYYSPVVDLRDFFSVKGYRPQRKSGLKITINNETVYPPAGSNELTDTGRGIDTGHTIIPIAAKNSDPLVINEVKKLVILAFQKIQYFDGKRMISEDEVENQSRHVNLMIHNPFGVIDFTINDKDSLCYSHSVGQKDVKLQVRLIRNLQRDYSGLSSDSPSVWNYSFKMLQLPRHAKIKDNVLIEPNASGIPQKPVINAQEIDIKVLRIATGNNCPIRITVYYDHDDIACQSPEGKKQVTLTADTTVYGSSSYEAKRNNSIISEGQINWSSKVKQPAQTNKTLPMQVTVEEN